MTRIERAVRRSLLVVLLALCVFPVGAFAQGPPADLDAWVARAMEAFEVPGIAVAIVKDGTVVHAKGYATKAFTAAALGMLVDDGLSIERGRVVGTGESADWFRQPVEKHVDRMGTRRPAVEQQEALPVGGHRVLR